MKIQYVSKQSERFHAGSRHDRHLTRSTSDSVQHIRRRPSGRGDFCHLQYSTDSVVVHTGQKRSTPARSGCMAELQSHLAPTLFTGVGERAKPNFSKNERTEQKSHHHTLVRPLFIIMSFSTFSFLTKSMHPIQYCTAHVNYRSLW
jgi:hypothetical protein